MNIPILVASVEFTATGVVQTTSLPMQYIPSKYALEVVGYDINGAVIAAGAWDVLLLGSLTGKVFNETSKILEHANGAQSNGDVEWSAGNFYPVRFAQIKCKALALGGASKIVVTVLGIK